MIVMITIKIRMTVIIVIAVIARRLPITLFHFHIWSSILIINCLTSALLDQMGYVDKKDAVDTQLIYVP